MPRAYALLRAGFPYVKSLGMRRVTSNPVDLAIGREGRLYVLCRGSLTVDIRRLTWDDEDLDVISGPGNADGKLLWPANILLDDDTLYVSDEGRHCISMFSTAGDYLGKWGKHGAGDGQFDRPSGMAFDPDGNLYVVDTLNHRIQHYTKDGGFRKQWGSFGSGEGEFNMPWGITVDDEGAVYVVDWRNDRVQKFDADGGFIAMFGSPGDGDGQFNRPTGMSLLTGTATSTWPIGATTACSCSTRTAGTSRSSTATPRCRRWAAPTSWPTPSPCASARWPTSSRRSASAVPPPCGSTARGACTSRIAVRTASRCTRKTLWN